MPGPLEEALAMDTFELSEDESARRENRTAEHAPRRTGTRSFFRRWMDAVREEGRAPAPPNDRQVRPG